MFEHRQRLAPEFAPPLRDDTRLRDDTEDWEAPRVSLLSSLVGASGLRRALSIVPLAVIGYAIAWFLYFEPSQDVTDKPVAESKPEAIQTAARRKYGQELDIVAEIDRRSGEIRLARRREVVDEVEDDSIQISLTDANAYDSALALGGHLIEPLPPIDLGRVAAA